MSSAGLPKSINGCLVSVAPTKVIYTFALTYCCHRFIGYEDDLFTTAYARKTLGSAIAIALDPCFVYRVDATTS
jgi:hypothetical protein